jgi:hypothetical protein
MNRQDLPSLTGLAAKAARPEIQLLPTTHVSEEASKFLPEARSCTNFNI